MLRYRIEGLAPEQIRKYGFVFQGKEFERYGIKVSRQNMAYWTIQRADRYLVVLYDYLHKKWTVITYYRRVKHLF